MGLAVVYHPDYVVPLPPGHRFPMAKFRALKDLLLKDNVVTLADVYTPEVPEEHWLSLVHNPAYISAYSQGTLSAQCQRRIGLPWSPALVNRTWRAVGGTILTAQLALKFGLACNTAGGTHHAFPDYGSGFCIFNDLAVAARVIQSQTLAKKILIVDLDVHQGDGTAFIFQDDDSVFTVSLHCQANFPGTKQTSDLDLPLPIGLEDQDYLKLLGQHLPDVISQVQPDLVLYDAGVDIHVGDRLGKLAITDSGIYCRDMQVLTTCAQAGIPVAAVIGGGYSDDFSGLVYRHSLLHRAAVNVQQQFY